MIEHFIRVAFILVAFAFVPFPEPAPHSFTNKAFHGAKRFGALAVMKVGGPSFELPIDALDGLFLRHMQGPVIQLFPNTIPQFLTAFGMRFHVRIAPPRVRTSVDPDIEPKKFEAILPSIQQACFSFIEFQLPSFQPALEPFQQRASSALRAKDHEVIGITHHDWHIPTLIIDGFIQCVEIQVGQKG